MAPLTLAALGSSANCVLLASTSDLLRLAIEEPGPSFQGGYSRSDPSR